MLGTVLSMGQSAESFGGVLVLLQHTKDGQRPFHSLGYVQLSCQRTCRHTHKDILKMCPLGGPSTLSAPPDHLNAPLVSVVD